MPRSPRKSPLKRKRPNGAEEHATPRSRDDSDSSGTEYDPLEEAIVTNASKRNLTTQNVKSILHHLLADKRLLQLAKSVAGDTEECEGMPEDVSAIEPKMTRSKCKPESPLKPCPSILDFDFREDSDDDEEYEPEKEDVMIPSEDESVSSFTDASVLESSHRTTEQPSSPVTPSAGRIQDLGNLQDLSPSSHSFKKPIDPAQLSKDEELISRRTRSKMPMQDISLDTIEAGFCAPDFDPDIYGTEEEEELDSEDLLWKAWLNDLSKPEAAMEESFDENDEDFNFMADEEPIDQEEFRNDRAVRVSQKELQELFDELLEGYDASEDLDATLDLDDNDGDQMDWRSFVMGGGTAKTAPSFSAEQREQLASQLQQHTQLLTQVYILCHEEPSLQHEATICKELTVELSTFQKRTKMLANGAAVQSGYSFDGLDEAVRLIESHPLTARTGPTLRSNRRPSPMLDDAQKPKTRRRRTDNQPIMLSTTALFFATESYFGTFFELLPMRDMISNADSDETIRPTFFQSEDNLLALGLSQFDRNWKLIQQNLLPIRTPKQLKTRYKNLCSKRFANNPVKHFKSTNLLPLFTNSVKIKERRVLPVLPLYKHCRQLSSHVRLPDWLRAIQQQMLSVERKSAIPLTGPDRLRLRYRTIVMKEEGLSTSAKKQLSSSDSSVPFGFPESPRDGDAIDLLSAASPLNQPESPNLPTPCAFTADTPPRSTGVPADTDHPPPAIESCSLQPIAPKTPSTSTAQIDSLKPNVLDNDESVSSAIQYLSPLRNTPDETTFDSPQGTDGDAGNVTIGPSPSAASRGQSKRVRRTPRQGPIRNRPTFNLEEKLNEKAQRYAEMFYDNVKNVLADDSNRLREFSNAIKLWTNKSSRTTVELYRTLSRILKDHPDLLDDFVGFMRQEEAIEVGKVEQWMHYDKAKSFLVNCERQLYKTPSSYKKLLKTIAEHASKGSATRQFIEAITPQFRGNQSLSIEFSTFFPDLPPPPSKSSDFEVIAYKPDIGFSYVDSYVEVPFSQIDEDNLGSISNRRRALALKKNTKKPTSTSKATPKRIKEVTKTESNQIQDRLARIDLASDSVDSCTDSKPTRDSSLISPAGETSTPNDGSILTPSTLLLGNDPDNTASQSSVPLSAQNVHFSQGSEKVIRWSRDDDRVILCTSQQKDASLSTFQEIAEKLKDKTVEEVKQRFYHLMELIEKQNS